MNENDIWLIAGLGNPEAKYDGTRHNAGFAALDALADKWNISVGKTKFQGLWGQGEVDGHKVVLLKPLTYMNLSGDSIAPMAGFFKIPADHVLVLCDDITQAPGKLRIRPSGSAGGHNGLKSIIARLGGENFPRIRIGIGAKPHPDYDMADWVLGRFSKEDRKAIDAAIQLVRSTGNAAVPLHLRNAPTNLLAQLGYHDGYVYPHDYPEHFARQQYMPDTLQGNRFWTPADNAQEAKIRERMSRWWGDGGKNTEK